MHPAVLCSQFNYSFCRGKRFLLLAINLLLDDFTVFVIAINTITFLDSTTILFCYLEAF